MTVATKPAPAPTRASAHPAKPGRRLRRFSKRDVILLAVLIGIPLLADLAFIWLPAVMSVVLSFTNWLGVGAIQPFVGLQQYHFAVAVDTQFWPAILHNLIWVAVFTLIATPLGMLCAVILDRNIRGSRIYQSVLFLPVMLSLALIGIIWELMYSENYGLINTLLGRTGSNAIDWIGNPHLNLFAMLAAASWRQVGYVMVLYLAGLKAADESLREAAQIDGANQWQIFWRVTFPTLRPVNIVIIVITVIESLRAYDIVFIMSHGTVLPGLELLSMLVTQYIIGQTQRIGYGSALASVLLVVSLVPICIFLVQSFRREDRE